MATTFFSRGRPAVAAALHTAESHSAHNDLTACRMRFAYGLRLLRNLRPLRHCGDTHAPTPTADYPPRASHFPGGQRSKAPDFAGGWLLKFSCTASVARE